MNTIYKMNYQEESKNFTQISNDIIDNPNLSFKAKGIALSFLKNQNGFFVYKTSLMKMGTDSRKSVDSGIEELLANGYVDVVEANAEIKEIVRRPNLDCIYVFHEEPKPELAEKWTMHFNMSKKQHCKKDTLTLQKEHIENDSNNELNIQSCEKDSLKLQKEQVKVAKGNFNMSETQVQHVQKETLTCPKGASNNTINNNINNTIEKKIENKKNNNIYSDINFVLLNNFLGNQVDSYRDNISDIEKGKVSIEDFFELFYEGGEYSDFTDYIENVFKEFLGEYYYNEDKGYIEKILNNSLPYKTYFNMCSSGKSYDDFWEYCSNYKPKSKQYEDTYSYLKSLESSIQIPEKEAFDIMNYLESEECKSFTSKVSDDWQQSIINCRDCGKEVKIINTSFGYCSDCYPNHKNTKLGECPNCHETICNCHLPF